MASLVLGNFSRTALRKVASSSRPILQPWFSMAVMQRSFASYPPHEVVGLPALSPTMESGSIGAWHVQPGDSFGAGDVICTVETDKATMAFEAQDDAILAKILVQAGSGEIKIGDPIMVTVESADDVAAFRDFTLTAAEAAPVAAPTPVAAAAAPQAAAVVPAAVPAATLETAPTGGRVVASPLAFMLAKEMGVPIEQIKGTGPGGRILAADVKEYIPLPAVVEAAASTAAIPAPAVATMRISTPVVGQGYTDYPLSVHAQEVAARLQQAKRNVPHYYLTVDVNMDKLLETRASLNATLPKGADPLGVYEFLIKATAAATKTVPSANAAWMDSVVRVYDHINLNVVVGSGDKLYTPVISNVASKGLKAISADLKLFTDALEPVEEGKDAPSVLGGLGTFTIMNLGMYGIKSCAPIIREPQSCALAIGALENRIVPNDDDAKSEEIYKEAIMMTATLSCDHRVVDGAVGAQWLAAFKFHVENPNSLLL